MIGEERGVIGRDRDRAGARLITKGQEDEKGGGRSRLNLFREKGKDRESGHRNDRGRRIATTT